MIRVRFAPSPTGYLHVGNARTALYNYLFAKKSGGKLILRIEDTDRERSKEIYTQAIFDDLKWFGLDWDEGPDIGGESGPYQQSRRSAIYEDFLNKLQEKDLVYRCYCTPEELKTRREQALASGKPPKYDGRCRQAKPQDLPYVWRFKVPENRNITFTDLVRGEVAFDCATLGDFVIFRSDGGPTFHFTVVVDDALMKISHVIRGEDHLSNTPKHILLFEAIEMSVPQFAHLPMILGKDRAPLSKRHGMTAIKQYRDLGYLPQALINYLTLLGWAPDDNQEIFTLEELVQKFSLERVNKAGAIFDSEKLDWISMQQMKLKTPSEIFGKAKPYLEAKGCLELASPSQIEKAIAIIQAGLRRYDQVPEKIMLLLNDEIVVQDLEALTVLKQTGVDLLLKTELEKIKALSEFSFEAVQKTFKETQKELGVKGKEFFLPLRVALTGEVHGPELAELIPFLGKERLIKRLERTLKC